MPYEVELVPAMFSSRLLLIDEESVIYGDIQMMFSEITGLVYGTDQKGQNLVGSKDSYFIMKCGVRLACGYTTICCKTSGRDDPCTLALLY
jgi:hypothetical protein